ncbi:MAG: hypothetical protein ACSLE6_05615 [Mycobacterium sp.]
MTKTTIHETVDSSVACAEQLWDRLRSGDLDFQLSRSAIIEARAWEPLGYESFSKAWVDKMAGVTIAAALRLYAVYELLAEHRRRRGRHGEGRWPRRCGGTDGMPLLSTDEVRRGLT